MKTDDQLYFLETPPARATHKNSKTAYREEKQVLGGRSLDILTNVRNCGPGTDREIAARMSFSHRSAVQPRISDLIRLGHLRETGNVLCEETHKTVRIVGI